jgi:hypothetical protein
VEVVGERAMASQVNFGIDDPRKNMLSSQVDLLFPVRQESIAADRDNLAIRNGYAAFDDSARSDDQTVFKDEVCYKFSHKVSLNPIQGSNF